MLSGVADHHAPREQNIASPEECPYCYVHGSGSDGKGSENTSFINLAHQILPRQAHRGEPALVPRGAWFRVGVFLPVGSSDVVVTKDRTTERGGPVA